MSQPLVEQIARAVLYEGYILYPYRPSSVKNQQRWTFGGIYPRAYSEAQDGSDAWTMQSQFLVLGSERSTLSVAVRFLHLVDRSVEKADPEYRRVSFLQVGDRDYHPWQEAMERSTELNDLTLGQLTAHSCHECFSFPQSQTIETLQESGQTIGRLVRDQQEINGSIELSAERVADGVYRLNLCVNNESAFDATSDRDAALMRSLVSSHMVLTAHNAGFISPTDPPEALAALCASCKNVGCWPVLVGSRGQTDTLLISPIILADYPQIAPESPGDLFDGCEIDEILTLRIMTMTDEEKRQAASADPMAAQLLARTESLAREQLMNLHGALRGVAGVMEEAHG